MAIVAIGREPLLAPMGVEPLMTTTVGISGENSIVETTKATFPMSLMLLRDVGISGETTIVETTKVSSAITAMEPLVTIVAIGVEPLLTTTILAVIEAAVDVAQLEPAWR